MLTNYKSQALEMRTFALARGGNLQSTKNIVTINDNRKYFGANTTLVFPTGEE